MNIFLGDEITLIKGDTHITGKVNGVKLDRGHLQLLSLEDISQWFDIGKGWRVLDFDDDYEAGDDD